MIDRFSGWLHRETRSITLAALLLAGASFSADLLGLLRDRLLASHFGAGELLDIYYAGFRIPDLLLNLLVLGAMSSAFLPVFSERYHRDHNDAWRFASNVLTLAAVALVFFSIVLFFATPLLLRFIAPGFGEEALERAIAITRILLVSPILFGISSILSSVLHYFQRFLLYSLAPILYNVGIIIGAVALAPRYGEIGLVFGVLLGALMHLFVQIPGMRAVGFRFRPAIFPTHPAVMDVVRLAVPRTANLVVNQMQITALTAIASIFAIGSIAVFNLGMNLAFVPVGVIGISFATAAFPALSRAFARRDDALFSRILRQTIQEILFFVFPVATLFLVLRAHIVRVLLGSGAFTWEDTRLTAAVLAAFSFGVLAQSLLPILVRTFFAQRNTVVPLRIGVVTALGTVSGAFFLGSLLRRSGSVRDVIGEIFRVSDLPDIGVLALPIAMTIATSFQALILLAYLHRRFTAGELRSLIISVIRLGASSMIAGGASWAMLQLLAEGIAQETGIGIFLQGFAAGVFGLLIFFVLALTLAFPEAKRLLILLRRSLPPFAAILELFDASPFAEDARDKTNSPSEDGENEESTVVFVSIAQKRTERDGGEQEEEYGGEGRNNESTDDAGK